MSREIVVSTVCFFLVFAYQALGDDVFGGGTPMQSPIRFDERNLRFAPDWYGLQTAYSAAPANLTTEHSGLKVTFRAGKSGGSFYTRGKEYNLVQFHFHSPPEHRFTSHRLPKFCDSYSKKAALEMGNSGNGESGRLVLEMHLVHTTPSNETAVIAVYFKLGETRNKFLDKFWDGINYVNNGPPVNAGKIDVSDLDLGLLYLRYRGSLTTAPYTEGVQWTVMCGGWNTISQEQYDLYKSKYPVISVTLLGIKPSNVNFVNFKCFLENGRCQASASVSRCPEYTSDANNRPIQAINGRTPIFHLPLLDSAPTEDGQIQQKADASLLQSS